MKHIIITLTLFLLFMMNTFGQISKKTITLKSTDDLTITADLYQTSDKKAPYIILYHQARYSRGEYLEIAPKLNAMGFNCIAIDQRSGNAINGVVNETHQRAVKRGLATEYTDAWPDLVSTLLYVNNDLEAKKIIVWGSSYSSALIFVLASKYADEIDGILSFSPGDYFEIDGEIISVYAENISCPVFITSSKSEEESWRPIYDNLNTKDKAYYLPEGEGFHGSKALWEENEGYEGYWKAVKGFLGQFR